MKNKELRYFNIDNFEVRNEGENQVVVGYGAVFNTESNDLGGFTERINQSAFDGRTEDDVRFLLNHDPNFIFGRTTSGTLRLSIDEIGLRYEVDLPDTQSARDLTTSLKRGDINQSSFAFTVEDDTWEQDDDNNIVRTINKVSRLYDVSAVTYPAYEEASVALRSMEKWQDDENKKIMKESLKKEKEENKKEEQDLINRNLAEMKLKIKSKN
jgi:HK97 family phage prohead protease